MSQIKADFPIFTNNPGLVFLDSTASTQKPQVVINEMKKYLENDYSNIHRGAYSLAERSEKLYEDSKKKLAEFLNASSWREVIYTYNSTYAANLIIASIKRSKLLKKGEKVLVSIVEHHANVVPWLILKEEIGIELEYIRVNSDFSLDYDDLQQKLEDPKVKIVSVTHVSNVTGEVFDLEKVGELVKQKEDRIFMIDASQSFPHFKVDVQKLQCDCLFFTAHKFGADSGMGILWGKKEFLEGLKPAFSGGGAISYVKKDCFLEAKLPDRFEPGTPNLSGAVSVLAALKYIESIGGYKKVVDIEDGLTKYFLEKLENFEYKNKITIIGSKNTKNRVSVFSFSVKGIHPDDVSDFLAESNICIRAGQHCAEPLMIELGVNSSCRASFWIYNNNSDIDIFFEELGNCIKVLGN